MKFKDKVIDHVSNKRDERLKIAIQQAKLTVFKVPHSDAQVKNKGTEEEEYEIVEREIGPALIICPDCGGETLEGLEYCDKCGGELN